MGKLFGLALNCRIPSQTYSNPESPVQTAADVVHHGSHRSSHFNNVQSTMIICNTVATFPRILGLTVALPQIIWMITRPTSNTTSRLMIVAVTQSGIRCKWPISSELRKLSNTTPDTSNNLSPSGSKIAPNSLF